MTQISIYNYTNLNHYISNNQQHINVNLYIKYSQFSKIIN